MVTMTSSAYTVQSGNFLSFAFPFKFIYTTVNSLITDTSLVRTPP